MHFVHPSGRPRGRYLHFVPVRAASDAPAAGYGKGDAPECPQ